MQLAAAGTGEYVINNSVYPDGSTGYFSRTPASAGNRRTFVISLWTKRTRLSEVQNVVGAGADGNNLFLVQFDSSDRLDVGNAVSGVYDWRKVSTQVFRDPSAWLHIVIVVDTTNGTAGDRVKIWVNGTQITDFSTSTNPSLNYDNHWNNASAHYIAARPGAPEFTYAYFAETVSIDGQALTPTSFGGVDINGVWKPKSYSGSYGTNGFHLKFENAAALGEDSSGNGNNWTKNGTVTQTTDSPTDKAADNIGNFCTLTPVADRSTNLGSLSEGNLRSTGTATGSSAYGTIEIPTSGKWYFEVEVAAYAQPNITAGIRSVNGLQNAQANHYVAYKNNDGQKDLSGNQSAYGETWTTVGDVCGVLYDADSNGGEITYYKNGTSQGVAATGLNANGPWIPYIVHNNVTGNSARVNFGQKAFAQTMPTGAKRLCTANLPAPAIKDPSAHFQVTLWTGDGNATKEINQSGNSTFQPDLVWTKNRTTALSHYLFDAVRGVNKGLHSDATVAERDSDSFGYVSAFDADGFTVQKGSETNSYTNKSGDNYVAWQWKFNGSGVSNTDGSISSTVSANATAGISIVKYTGTGSVGTVGHGLGKAPKLIIIKRISGATAHWQVFHASRGATKALRLNTADAEFTSSTYWNDTSPTSTVFTIATDGDFNTNGAPYIAYCFAEIDGFSRFGQYTGNGNADGPFAWCGFRPKYVMVKRVDSTGDWQIHDAVRDTKNPAYTTLYPHLANADDPNSGIHDRDFLSNGFKFRGSHASFNASGGTYIFIAFAEFPFGGSKTTQARAR